jgi:hypothetical protein
VHEVWSLNWDCWQENAFENVGIKRKSGATNLPWLTRFNTFITAADCHDIAADVLAVVKPHGCVTALQQAELAVRQTEYAKAKELADRFIITESELQDIRPNAAGAAQDFIFTHLCDQLAQHPLIVAGWSISEPYLVEYIRDHVAPILAENELAIDELSIIDLDFNGQGHTQMAGFYGRDASAAHVPVQLEPGFTTNRLFLWLEALYGVACLQVRGYDETAGPRLERVLIRLRQPTEPEDFTVSFIDDFLPVWTRLCWRCEAVYCVDQYGHQIPSDSINLESRDEHIPWNIPNIDRPDLRAAARLLATIDASRPERWDYRKFPGGIFDANDQFLVIPVPAWSTNGLNDLRGLKALMDSVIQQGPGFVDRLGILPLGSLDADQINLDTANSLKELVAQQFPVAHFAQSANIENVELLEI